MSGVIYSHNKKFTSHTFMNYVVKQIIREISIMHAYMVNDYYVLTSYEDLASLIHDIIHYSLLPTDQDHHSFSIRTGHVDTRSLRFHSDNEDSIPLRYENEDDVYYCA